MEKGHRSIFKHCPFCWSTDTAFVIAPVPHSDLIEYYVECHSCKATGPLVTSSKRAVELWNDRSPNAI